ncbi:receptor-like protein 2 [Dorcoceras hygrometricum]|uniref:Receptor-like protein 2 n=1 Tax=Dorcoceras hygrometricum TaxID=472368 RepID=A0A2Z7BXL0_9LAMI|nr:receptor-like protein 2 [Dorcoceras hygrometricum]
MEIKARGQIWLSQSIRSTLVGYPERIEKSCRLGELRFEMRKFLALCEPTGSRVLDLYARDLSCSNYSSEVKLIFIENMRVIERLDNSQFSHMRYGLQALAGTGFHEIERMVIQVSQLVMEMVQLIVAGEMDRVSQLSTSYADAVDKAMDIEDGLSNHKSWVQPQAAQGSRPNVLGAQPPQLPQSSQQQLQQLAQQSGRHRFRPRDHHFKKKQGSKSSGLGSSSSSSSPRATFCGQLHNQLSTLNPKAHAASLLSKASAAVASTRRRRLRRKNSFRPTRRGESVRADLVGLLVQPDEGVSDLVVDRIGVNYRNLPRRAGFLKHRLDPGTSASKHTPPPSSQKPPPPSPPRAAAAAAVFARKIVSGQLDEENPFVPISSGLLVQPDEGVSDLVVDRIGVNYHNLPRRAGFLKHRLEPGTSASKDLQVTKLDRVEVQLVDPRFHESQLFYYVSNPGNAP